MRRVLKRSKAQPLSPPAAHTQARRRLAGASVAAFVAECQTYPFLRMVIRFVASRKALPHPPLFLLFSLRDPAHCNQARRGLAGT